MEVCCSARYLLNLSFLCFRVIKFLWLGLHGAGLLLPPQPYPFQTPSKGMSGCELKLNSSSAFCRRSLSRCDSRAKGVVKRSRLAAHPACVLWLIVSVCGSHSCMMRGWRQAAFPWEQLFTWVCSYFKAHWLLCVFVCACVSVLVRGEKNQMVALWGEEKLIRWRRVCDRSNFSQWMLQSVHTQTGKLVWNPEEDGGEKTKKTCKACRGIVHINRKVLIILFTERSSRAGLLPRLVVWGSCVMLTETSQKHQVLLCQIQIPHVQRWQHNSVLKPQLCQLCGRFSWDYKWKIYWKSITRKTFENERLF